jgi:integrase
MLNLAERWGMRPIGSNPCKRVQRTTERSRRRHITAEEVPRIAAALEAHKETAPAGVAFLWLLLFSGARLGEIAAARWDQVEGSVLRLPDSKTGPRSIHIPPVAMEILAKLPRNSATLTGIKSPAHLWERIRKEANCEDLRIHDLRRSFASAGLSAGLSLSAIGELLGHKSAQTTKTYAHLMTDAGTAAATIAADAIAKLMKPTP